MPGNDLNTPPVPEPGADVRDTGQDIERESGLSGGIQQQGGASLANIGEKRGFDQLGVGSDGGIQGEETTGDDRRDQYSVDESADGEG